MGGGKLALRENVEETDGRRERSLGGGPEIGSEASGVIGVGGSELTGSPVSADEEPRGAVGHVDCLEGIA